jgi:hypothetical protein
MTKLGLLGAAAVVLSSALAGPAMAQQVIYNPSYCAQYPDANCQNLGPGNPYTGDYRRRTAYRSYGSWNNDGWNNGWHDSWNDNRWDRRYDSGFWPADVAADVVGGAIGTAAAIATAPFRSDSYAYYNDDSYGYYNNGYYNNGYYNNGYYNNGYRGGPKQSYAPRTYAAPSYATLNGFVCQPGTWFRGGDGRRHICR